MVILISEDGAKVLMLFVLKVEYLKKTQKRKK